MIVFLDRLRRGARVTCLVLIIIIIIQNIGKWSDVSAKSIPRPSCLVRLSVCLFVCQSLVTFRLFRQLLRSADKRIINIMKVYMERNNMQVELIRFRKNIDFIHV